MLQSHCCSRGAHQHRDLSIFDGRSPACQGCVLLQSLAGRMLDLGDLHAPLLLMSTTYNTNSCDLLTSYLAPGPTHRSLEGFINAGRKDSTEAIAEKQSPLPLLSSK